MISSPIPTSLNSHSLLQIGRQPFWREWNDKDILVTTWLGEI